MEYLQKDEWATFLTPAQVSRVLFILVLVGAMLSLRKATVFRIKRCRLKWRRNKKAVRTVLLLSSHC